MYEDTEGPLLTNTWYPVNVRFTPANTTQKAIGERMGNEVELRFNNGRHEFMSQEEGSFKLAMLNQLVSSVYFEKTLEFKNEI